MLNHKLPTFTQAISQLIAQPSISSSQASWDQSNADVIHLLAAWFETLGFTITIQAVPGLKGKLNMLAKLGSGTGGLLLAGHSDTVPFDEQRWHSDPFKLSQKDDKLFGLGSCDMKGFFAFILQACQPLAQKPLKKPLYVLATADEETTMAGARFFANSGIIKPDVAVIGEPTNLVPVVMHKGHMSHKITVKGQAGHSSNPAQGVNAIEIMHQVISQLFTLRDALNLKYQNPAFDVQTPTLNLGAVHGGDNANRICGHCELDIDMRSLPGMKDEELVAWLSNSLATIAEKYPGRLTITELDPSSPSFQQNENSDLVRHAEQFSGHSCCAVNYATEAPFIQQLGCQTIVLGPGSIAQAHQPNEFLALSEINKTERLLSQLIHQYCF
ncbi:acetylornithine deacetylase [Colwellia chukchiensis]|uniref:Acetylornithine deacetylase n=1 Tax=Colwellia chukchiensis TaxID=641665 RepID=A0A1H7PSK6_9GAMM|nr:acetylornithine deacetylase [Colwellia chukchiensis]SEL38448.1 acetylornithine deacetylase [Colwellia chukchiensis]